MTRRCLQVFAACVLLACTKVAPRQDRNGDVSDSVTIARCHREVNCGRVGDGKRFHDDTACRRALDARPHQSIGGAACGDVDTTALATCLAAIERARCDDADPFEPACGGDVLCTHRTRHGTTASLAP